MQLFRRADVQGISIWNAVTAGLVQNGRQSDVLGLLHEMIGSGMVPNSATLSIIIPSVPLFSTLLGVKQAHGYAIRNNYDQSISVVCALIDAYSKAGFFYGALKVFELTGDRSKAVWTSIISAAASHGEAAESLRLFYEMISAGTRRDTIAFTAVLTACAHAGKVADARKIFDSMQVVFGITPVMEQYACMVSALSRAGMLNDALELVNSMPFEPNAKQSLQQEENPKSSHKPLALRKAGAAPHANPSSVSPANSYRHSTWQRMLFVYLRVHMRGRTAQVSLLTLCHLSVTSSIQPSSNQTAAAAQAAREAERDEDGDARRDLVLVSWVNGGGGEGGGGMRTVDCLRGRLLAERVASKAAKEEADQLAKRLDELEKKLADEVKVRNKAERRLRRAIKKLESLKILDVELSDGSISSLSSNGRSGHQAPEVEERNSPGSLTTDDSVPSGPQGGGDVDADSAKGSSAGSCTQGNSQDGSWCSVVSEQSPVGACMDLAGTNSSSSSEESTGDHDSERQHLDASSGCGSAKSEAESFHDSDDRLALVLVDPPLVAQAGGGSRTEDSDTQTPELHAVTHDYEEAQQEEEENKLAIVLADPQRQPAGAPKPHADVESVLLALRRVKEQLRYTIERRSELVSHRELYGH
ncbi:uncharacterized protein C2845_PM01G11480 [Panicum miliaceum]|uniref:Pentatricopeptide repeat-containing protein n=1 Tax=Panicum miliaceum TaxID=4540 RepID=A0A3L6TNK4_PANMI|nr:uncharacterized protein C2845_PM01G11480 [Panicum miliaceum]